MKSKSFYYTPFNTPVYIMPKPVGSACNINCTYCYYLEKDKLYARYKQNIMSLELLEKYICDYIQGQHTTNILFTWHGGEALMRGIHFYKKAIEFQKKYARGKTISNSLQTNGLRLNSEWCQFFNENNFLIGISIDGPVHCHDKYRLDNNSNGTFSRVMNGIELLNKYNVEFNILAVVNNYNVAFPKEIYNFFKSINAHYIQFTPIVERKGSRTDGLELLSPLDKNLNGVTEWSVKAMDFGKFLTDIFDEWVINDVGKYFVTTFDATLAGYLDVPAGSCIWSKTCGNAAVMEFNGDIYSCDHFVFPEYKLGNINKTSINALMFSEQQLKFGNNKFDSLPNQCLNCEFLKMCYGECPKNRFITTTDGEPGLNYLCSGYLHYFNYVKPYMEFMANEIRNKRSPANVMDWARTIRISH